MITYLETSSYLPLIWITPYSHSVVELMRAKSSQGNSFALQRDCILEASGYLSFKDDWRYNPALRCRRLADKLSDRELDQLPFPSTAIQLLLGGNIWPQAQYLNFIRHTTFFFADLLDHISFDRKREGLAALAERVDKRVQEFRAMFVAHSKAATIRLPVSSSLLPYWGKWYLTDVPQPFEIEVVDDPRPYNMTSDKLRDIYHYDCAVNAALRPDEMIVANTGFRKNVGTSFAALPIPITCATTISTAFFGEEKV